MTYFELKLYLAEIKLLNEKIKYNQEVNQELHDENRRLHNIMQNCERQKTKCEDDLQSSGNLQNVQSGNAEVVILMKELELYKKQSSKHEARKIYIVIFRAKKRNIVLEKGIIFCENIQKSDIRTQKLYFIII